MSVKIIGTGSFIPERIEKNKEFDNHVFLNEDGTLIPLANTEIIEKFKAITGIAERRYAPASLNTSDLGFLAAQKAIEDAEIDAETIDYLIVAHNFGDVRHTTIQSDILPCLAARIKNRLHIQNPKCVAYDILFGCPGWIEGVIQANAFIHAGIAKTCLVIGAEGLSRVVDKHDRDSMIYSDGAGAAIFQKTNATGGILAHETSSYTYNEAYYLYFGQSNNKNLNPDIRYIKMQGRKIYEFALQHVPMAMKTCLEKSNVDIKDIKKILLHQANEKMDIAIIKRFYALFNLTPPDGVMPMTIAKLGNSSVATIPTLIDLIRKNKVNNQEINPGDFLLLASVGAGMNINAIVYQY